MPPTKASDAEVAIGPSTPRGGGRLKPRRLFAPALQTVKVLGISQKRYDRNGGAETPRDIKTGRKTDPAKEAARAKRIALSPRPKKLKERKKDLAKLLLKRGVKTPMALANK